MSQESLKSVFNLPILVSKMSNRQSYVFDLIFKQILGINYHYVDSTFTEKVLSYGIKASAFHQEAHGLLYETNIEKQDLEYVSHEGFEFPFKISEPSSLFSFDLFAVCFYCVSRYEEYIETELDEHGRFKPESSWVHEKGMLKIPVVNYLASQLKKKLEDYFNVSLPDVGTYKIQPTLDIDNGYAHYNRYGGSLRARLKSLLKLDFASYKYKSKAIKSKDFDPFNTHSKLIETLSEHNFIVFFLMKCGGKNSTNDVNNKTQHELIHLYKNAQVEIGLHPSYEVKFEEEFKEEVDSLKRFFPALNSSRYHYIKNTLPDSYNYLVKNGIYHEYSMGYAVETGFRAGVCKPYYWFSLLTDETTKLMIHPFYFMDATYVFNMKLSPEKALDDLSMITEQVRKYKGINSFVFHNESLSDYDVYVGWADFLDNTLERVL